MKVLWRPRARNDFENQIAYIEARNPPAARRLRLIVENTVGLLNLFPERGRPSRRKDVRELVVLQTPFIVVYRVAGDEVVVLRLFHIAQRRD